ncbi:MAG TPA: PQQ-binding-like beta-propeller repeat protein, partial [Kofleriaceae bacterium]|nr:PQQ-binding-like beta-propeller repeat protein [Kofleriaceae bacterium]
MRPTKLALALVAAAIPTSIGTYALAKRAVSNFDAGPPAFELNGRPVGGTNPAAATAARLTGSRIMAAGEGALVIDADSGALVRTDKTGTNIGQVQIGRDAGLMTYDGTTAYVADRKGDRIAVVKVGDALAVTQSIKTPVEPYGVALSPDSKTLYVTTVADRALVAYDAASGTEKWRTALGREPRGIAISPDGTRGLVAYLATGTVDQIDLAAHEAEHVALSAAVSERHCRRCGNNGDSFARGAFAVTFMGDHEAVVPFQRETPIQAMNGSENTGSYGGGFEPPVTHHLAFLGLGSRTTQTSAQIAQHQPRALAWDSAHDALYVAGLGSDSILQIRHASQVGIVEGLTVSLDADAEAATKDRCGPDGLAITPSGNVLVWCSFQRAVRRVDFIDAKGEFAATAAATKGTALIASAMSSKQHEGMVIFHSSSAQVSMRGSMACATCHPDGRADGLSWRIEKHELQTPILAGRVVGTGPFKWDGTDPDLKASMTSTMKRLGGSGLNAAQTDALAAYLENMSNVRTPMRPVDAVARGKKLFDSAELGCRSCHDGKAYTDQERHKLTGGLAETDTPSLLGLAASA